MQAGAVMFVSLAMSAAVRRRCGPAELPPVRIHDEVALRNVTSGSKCKGAPGRRLSLHRPKKAGHPPASKRLAWLW